jgi:hypothetical protein
MQTKPGWGTGEFELIGQADGSAFLDGASSFFSDLFRYRS